jgi:para-nitrobenzyl esterase
MATDYAASLGITGEGSAGLKALRNLSAEKLSEETDAKAEVAARSAGKPIIGVAGSMLDGKQVVEMPEAAFAAGHQAKAPIIIGANDRDLPVGVANSKDELFAIFGANVDEARKLYDPNGDQPLMELARQVFADRTMTEPARHFADLDGYIIKSAATWALASSIRPRNGSV